MSRDLIEVFLSFPELLGLLFFILTRYHQKTEEIHKMARPQKKIKIDQLISVLREMLSKSKGPKEGVYDHCLE